MQVNATMATQAHIKKWSEGWSHVETIEQAGRANGPASFL